MLRYLEEKSYKKAMEIADSINWKKVTSVAMLSSVSEIYEANREYQKSRDVLFMAYDRAPGSKKIIYRLGETALLLGDVAEAADSYEEFCKVAPKDPNQYILCYQVLKLQKAPQKEQIKALEALKKAEYIEKWAYELAKLYHEAGMKKECIEECDDLALWFSEGKYVYRAMELKMLYKPLTAMQQERYDKQKNEMKGNAVFQQPQEPATTTTDSVTEEISIAEINAVDINIADTSMPDVSLEEMVVEEKMADNLGDTKVISRDLLSKALKEDSIFIQPKEKEEEAMNKEDQDLIATGQMKIDAILKEWEAKQKENAVLIQEKQKEQRALETKAKMPTLEPIVKETGSLVPDDIRELMESLENGTEEDLDDDNDIEEYEVEETEDDQPTDNMSAIVDSLKLEDLDDEDELEEVEYEDDELEDDEHDEDELDEDEYEEVELEEDDYDEDELEDDDYDEDDYEEDDYDEEDYEEDDYDEDELEEDDYEEDDYEEDDYDEDDYEEDDYDEDELEEDDYDEDDYEEDDYEEDELEEDDYDEEDYEEDDYDEDESEEDDYEEDESEEDDYDEDDYEEDDYEEDDYEEDESEEDDYEEDELEEDDSEQDLDLAIEKKLKAEEKSKKESKKETKKGNVSKGGVSFDTGFVVQGRYDLSATSEIGLQVGLTEEQKKLFSYFVPIRGVSEQIVDVLENDKRGKKKNGTSKSGNILVVGRKGTGKTVLAVNIVKAIQKQRQAKQGRVAIVTGDALNKKELSGIIPKLNGGAMIIEKAGKLNTRTIRELNELMEGKTNELLIILEEQRKGIEKMMTANPEFKKKFTSKIELPIFINDELVTFGQTYAKEMGYRIDDMGILALYSRIDIMQREDHAVTVAEVKNIMDEAIDHSKKGNVKHLVKRVFGKNTDEGERVILTEEDFK